MTMTIARLLGDKALFATDTRTWLRGRPSGQAAKLAALPLPAVISGRGSSSGLRHAIAIAMASATDGDSLLDGASAARAEARADAYWPTGSAPIELIIGAYSERRGRLVVAIHEPDGCGHALVDGETVVRPVPVGWACGAPVPPLPTNLQTLEAFARALHRDLVAEDAQMSGGALVLAELDRAGVRLHLAGALDDPTPTPAGFGLAEPQGEQHAHA